MHYVSQFETMLLEFETAVSRKLGNGPFEPQQFVPYDELARLRERLIDEEAGEVSDELQDGTKVGLAKELADLAYVTFGTAVKYGIPLGAVFYRVHDNNMLKINTATVDAGGKLVKAKDHPKVVLDDLVSP